MAAISIQQKIVAASLAQSGTYTDVFDMTNHKSASVQFSKTGTGKGTAKLQWSNDGTTWKDVNTTIYPDATSAVAAGAATVSLSCVEIAGALVRVSFLEDGTGAVAITGGKWIGKLH